MSARISKIRPALEAFAANNQAHADRLSCSPHRHLSPDCYGKAIAGFQARADAARKLLEGDDSCDILDHLLENPE